MTLPLVSVPLAAMYADCSAIGYTTFSHFSEAFISILLRVHCHLATSLCNGQANAACTTVFTLADDRICARKEEAKNVLEWEGLEVPVWLPVYFSSIVLHRCFRNVRLHLKTQFAVDRLIARQR